MRRWCTARLTAAMSRTSVFPCPSTAGSTACTCGGGRTCSRSWSAVQSSLRWWCSLPPRRSMPSSSSTSWIQQGVCARPAHLFYQTLLLNLGAVGSMNFLVGRRAFVLVCPYFAGHCTELAACEMCGRKAHVWVGLLGIPSRCASARCHGFQSLTSCQPSHFNHAILQQFCSIVQQTPLQSSPHRFLQGCCYWAQYCSSRCIMPCTATGALVGRRPDACLSS